MKKKSILRNAIVLIGSAILVTALSACTLAPNVALRTALDKSAKVTSQSSTIKTDIVLQMTYLGLSTNMDLTLNTQSDIVNQPTYQKLTTTSVELPEALQKITQLSSVFTTQIYTEGTNSYTGSFSIGDKPTDWKISSKENGNLAQVNLFKLLEFQTPKDVMKYVSDVAIDETRTTKETQVITTLISEEYFQRIINPAMPSTGTATSSDGTTYNKVPVTFWIDADKEYIVHISADFNNTQIPAMLLSEDSSANNGNILTLFGTGGVNISQLNIDIENTNHDNISVIAVPDGIAEAN